MTDYLLGVATGVLGCTLIIACAVGWLSRKNLTLLVSAKEPRAESEDH